MDTINQWGCTEYPSGELIEHVIDIHDLCLFNDTSHTYLHPANGNHTSLDLAICHPSIFLDFEWNVGDDLCGSDHFPILLKGVATSGE